jgi:type II secretory pathway component PulJ
MIPDPNNSRRGFTLLETVLAAVLGALVIIASMALFRVLERSDKRSIAQLEQNNEFAMAHKTIARAMSMLLMSDEPAPNEREIDEFLAKDDERNSADRAEEPDEDAATTRLAIQPDIDNPTVMLVGVEGRQRRVRGQQVRVTLRDTPVLDSGEKSPEQAFAERVRKERILMRAQERLGKRFGGGAKAGASDRTPTEREARSARRESGQGGGEGSLDSAMDAIDRATGQSRSSGSRERRRLSLRDRNPGSDRSDLTASERLDLEDEERPRAPGVRGVFELLPDTQEVAGGINLTGRSVRTVAVDPGGPPTFSLWWRELPPIEVNAGSDPTLLSGEEMDEDGSDNSGAALSESRTRDRSSRSDREGRSASDRARDRRGGGLDGATIDRQIARLASASQGTGKRVRLLSGLTTCHWTAFRGRKERDKITAKFDRHLPAFIELEIVTAAGRRENWIFDVGWTNGPEPGSVLPEQPDALNNPAGVGKPNQPGDTNGDGDGKGGGGQGGDGKGGGGQGGDGKGGGDGAGGGGKGIDGGGKGLDHPAGQGKGGRIRP